jgi:PAS domain S-box-containing protein
MRSKIFSNSPEIELNRLRNILDSAGDGFIMLDCDGNIVDANETLCKNLGYAFQDILALKIGDIDDEVANAFSESWETVQKQGPDIVRYGRHKCKDGTTYPVEIKMFPIEYGGIAYLSAFIRDVSDRKVIEEKLKLTQFAVDHAGDAAFWLDAVEHKFIYVNKKACEFLGYTHEELTTMGVSDIDMQFTDELWPKFVKRLKLLNEIQFETDFRHKDGMIFPVELTANHMEYEGRCYVVAFVREISARRKVEKDLRDAKEKSEQASQAKSEFLTSMSHELKTPLNAIIGYSDMLATEFSSVLSSEEKHFAKSIYQAGLHLLGLIDDVLDLATIESGKVNLEFEPVNVYEIVVDSIAITKLLAEKKNITFNADSAALKEINVWADKKKLTQVIINLLSNAIKYNRQDGSVTIECQQNENDCRINIIDTGYGIPEDKRKQIFSPFSRLGKENSDIEGTGVGLVICKSLVELMGGAIDFDSTPDEGTCFYLIVPNAEAGPVQKQLVSNTG